MFSCHLKALARAWIPCRLHFLYHNNLFLVLICPYRPKFFNEANNDNVMIENEKTLYFPHIIYGKSLSYSIIYPIVENTFH